MDVAAFIAEYRTVTGDLVPTYLWSDETILGYLNDALNEACERALLIEDRATSACCELTLAADTDTYALHASVIKIKRLTFRGRPLARSSVEEEDAADSRWETRTGEPQRYIEAEGSVRLVPTPNATVDGELVKLTVYRRPLVPRTLTAPANGAPEIPERYHLRLMDWLFYRGYSNPDPETINKARAAEHEARFAANFGQRIDANVQRKQRDRRPPVVRFQW